MAFIEDSAPQKMQACNLSTSFLRHWLLQTPGEENPKKRKKDALSLAIGENYIDKIFLFF